MDLHLFHTFPRPSASYLLPFLSSFSPFRSIVASKTFVKEIASSGSGSAVSTFAFGVFDSRLVVWGGDGSNSVSDKTEEYEPATKTWSDVFTGALWA